ncbi:MAG: (Fe-S)-binding protein, partial [Desulfomonilaceae bacterium]
MDLHDLPKPHDLMNIDLKKPPETGWMSNPAVFRDGTYSYPAAAKNLKILGMPNPRQWGPTDDD